MFFSSTLQITSEEHERWHSTLCILKKNLAVTMTNEWESAQCITQIGLSLTTDTSARKHPWRLLLANRELKQQWRWRLTKHRLKWIFTASKFIVLIPSCLIRQIWSLILKDCIKVQEKKRKVVVLCSSPRKNVKWGTFTL